ncbi:hypothetical protein PR048_019649 [Dryococelus australis]|uniref:Uncharacterized protein n=1 Tax=Dryococelus australis TaxID=614101 RepID=A0ABQ9H429_9NEOP|nr:hypothetical protein PR048_019649 [Dryococelus australis]
MEISVVKDRSLQLVMMTEIKTVQEPTLPACSDPKTYQTLEPTDTTGSTEGLWRSSRVPKSVQRLDL